MRFRRIWLLSLLSLLAVVAPGCSATVAPAPDAPVGGGTVSSEPAVPEVSAAQLEAEAVYGALRPEVDAIAETHGEGTNSPCNSGGSEFTTPACGEMADAMEDMAGRVLEELGENPGYATLRRVADDTLRSAREYEENSCAEDATDVEHCRGMAAVIAQSPRDFADALVMGLSGL